MTTEKPFIVFSGDTYYPVGGMNDYQGSFETLEAAKHWLIAKKEDWGHIMDIRNKNVVYYQP